MPKTLYVAISAHGYGHIAQTAPVLNELHRRDPALRIVIECEASRELLEKRLAMDFEHVAVASDFGMEMKNALEVDAQASHARYVALHRTLDAQVEAASRRLVQHGADLLLANVPYVPLLAAARTAVPALAMCSLNWADIYGRLCGGMPGAREVHADMLAAYRAANVFIALEPCMDMVELGNLRRVGPIAAVGHDVREALRSRLGLGANDRLVTVSMGGIATELAPERWPRVPGITWIMPDSVETSRSDIVRHSGVDHAFLDIVRASDALVTKPGYGAFAEAACNGVPVLYVPRKDWPEARFLVSWLDTHGSCREISADDLYTGRLAESLDALWSSPRRPAVAPTGIAQAADIVQAMLRSAARSAAELLGSCGTCGSRSG